MTRGDRASALDVKCARAVLAVGHAVWRKEVDDERVAAGGAVAVALHALASLLVQLRRRARHASALQESRTEIL